MPFAVACSCGKQFKVQDHQAGKKSKCTGCGEILLLTPAPAAQRAAPVQRAASVPRAAAAQVAQTSRGAATAARSAPVRPAVAPAPTRTRAHAGAAVARAPARPAPPPAAPSPAEPANDDPFANVDWDAVAEAERNAPPTQPTHAVTMPPPAAAPAQAQAPSHTPCPACGMTISVRALKCEHCGVPLTAGMAKAARGHAADDTTTSDASEGGGGSALASWGVTMLIIGVGSFILPLMGLQFKILIPLGDAAPIGGVVLAILGGVLIAIGKSG